MMIITATGNLGGDAELKMTDGGDAVCKFSVAGKAGKDDPTVWLRCSLWGKRGEKLAQYLKKGGKVTVVGDLKVGEYNGKPTYDVRVHDVAFGGDAKPKSAEQGTSEIPF